MGGHSSYSDTWVDTVREGVLSYRDVISRLRDVECYFRRRDASRLDDYGTGGSGLRIEIPLLWGTF